MKINKNDHPCSSIGSRRYLIDRESSFPPSSIVFHCLLYHGFHDYCIFRTMYNTRYGDGCISFIRANVYMLVLPIMALFILVRFFRWIRMVWATLIARGLQNRIRKPTTTTAFALDSSPITAAC